MQGIYEDVVENEEPSSLLEIEQSPGPTIQVGRWHLSEEKVQRYLKLIRATENGNQAYNYAYDDRRKALHDELMEDAGVQIHDVREYSEFKKELHALCDVLYPLPDDGLPVPRKVVTPPRFRS